MEQIVVDNRYALSRPLGGGGMAKVYLARDEVLDRDVAIKLLREQYADDEEFVERFKREAQSAASLSHPHIVQVYDRGRSGAGDYYIAMEYVPGGTLKDRLVRDGALAPGVAAGVAEQIADALSAAHEKGVVHRDIKPQNVLVTRSGDVKVTDFGIARAASSAGVTATSVVLGTAGYMSPEQARGEPVGPASDLYSLGVLLFEMLTGNLPYRAENPMALAMQHASQPVRSPSEDNPEVPAALDAITTRLLAKDPAARYPSADALAGDLERIQSGLAPRIVDAEKTQLLAEPLAPLPRAGDDTARTTARRPTTAAPPPYYGGSQARRRSRLIPAMVVMLLLVALLAIGAYALARGFDWNLTDSPLPTGNQQAQQAAQVGVPDVVGGFTQDEAVAELEAAGLVADPQPAESSFEDEGYVLQQDPAAGERLPRGETVTIDVGSGPAAVTVPDLVWEADVPAALGADGLVPGDTEYRSSATIPAGQVIESNPAEGSEAEPGDTVDIVVSTGPEQRQYDSPGQNGGNQRGQRGNGVDGGNRFGQPANDGSVFGGNGNNRNPGGGEGGED